jgi:hypothetical protein
VVSGSRNPLVNPPEPVNGGRLVTRRAALEMAPSLLWRSKRSARRFNADRRTSGLLAQAAPRQPKGGMERSIVLVGKGEGGSPCPAGSSLSAAGRAARAIGLALGCNGSAQRRV